MTSVQNSIPLTTEEMGNLAEELSVSRTKSGFMDEELKIGRKIGDGSFGYVHEAFYVGDKVAVKMFRTESATFLVPPSESRDEDIQNEANVMIKKSNKHMVRLLHHSKSRKVLVMEYYANGSVFDFMRHAGNRPAVEDWGNRLKWMHGVALGMLVLHVEPPSVLHRDLKLLNILLDDNLDAKIGDFGLAVKMSEIYLTRNNHSRPNLAMTYQPPEVRREGRYSTKSDVYSFGIMMHELLLLKGPCGLSLDAGYVDVRVSNLQEKGEKPSAPEDRTAIPGEWHPCLEDYIKLMNKCLADIPEDRPEFREIAPRLALIRKEYEKWKKMPHKYQPIIRVVAAIGFIMVFLTFLFLLFECGRIASLGKKDGNQVSSNMKSDEYYFFEVLVCIGIVAFATICGWILWIEQKSIASFVMTCTEHTRCRWEHLISRLNKIYKGRESVAPLHPKPTVFTVPPHSEGMTEQSPDIEEGTAPLLCLELTDQNESASCDAFLQSAISPSASQECLMVGDEQVVMIDDDVV